MCCIIIQYAYPPDEFKTASQFSKAAVVVYPLTFIVLQTKIVSSNLSISNKWGFCLLSHHKNTIHALSFFYTSYSKSFDRKKVALFIPTNV